MATLNAIQHKIVAVSAELLAHVQGVEDKDSREGPKARRPRGGPQSRKEGVKEGSGSSTDDAKDTKDDTIDEVKDTKVTKTTTDEHPSSDASIMSTPIKKPLADDKAATPKATATSATSADTPRPAKPKTPAFNAHAIHAEDSLLSAEPLGILLKVVELLGEVAGRLRNLDERISVIEEGYGRTAKRIKDSKIAATQSAPNVPIRSAPNAPPKKSPTGKE